MLRKCVANFVDLLFPECCAGCDQPLVRGEVLICVNCRYHVPQTGFHLEDFHEGFQLLGGQMPLEAVLAYLYFDNDSRAQRMIHQLKYFDKPALAYRLGIEYGVILRECRHPCGMADVMVPVPMSRAKQRKRGYNQSEVFARGLSSIIGVPVLPRALRRKSSSRSQVGKGRMERFRNLSSAILPGDVDELAGKHVLLVDDVLTSGATVVACADTLIAASVDRISVVAIARKR